MINQDPHQGMRLTSVLSKEIMGLVREGDYQHPGEEEAIELLFRNAEKSENFSFLDVGSGYGGTAAYIEKKKWGKVIGIDINPDVVAIARKKYINPTFITADVLTAQEDIERVLKKKLVFDVIYLFNSFCLFSDHQSSLKQLSVLSKPLSKLLIFDYVDYGKYMKNPYIENEKLLLPNIIKKGEITHRFSSAGWEVESVENIDDLYVKWYQELKQKIEAIKIVLSEKYGRQIYNIFLSRYFHILTCLEEKILGGVIITACVKNS